MELSEVIGYLKAHDLGQLPEYRVAMLRNVTLEFPALYLRHRLAQDGLNCVVRMGEYNNAVQEALAPDSTLYEGRPDLIVLALAADPLVDSLVHGFAGLSSEEVEREMALALETFATILGAIRRNTDTPVLVHSLETPARPSLGVLDSQTSRGQLGAFRELNARLQRQAAEHSACYLVDLDLLRLRVGADRFIDLRFWHMGLAPYSAEGSEALAAEYAVFVRALTGRVRKCLVLDCDNTLWSGILGEDGYERIAMGSSHPGSAYRDVQRVCLELNRRGVLLALCSKNNEQDVLHVLDTHPDMLIRREQVACTMVNWQNKADNIREIARLLNIGLDSLVFVDDSDFEVNLVRESLPQVEVIHFKGAPERFAGLIASCGLFDSLNLTDEDRRRPAMYKAEVGRRAAAEQLGSFSFEEYLAHLEMRVSLRMADAFTLPRISQLTMRTNQFNLTTRRYTEDALNDMLAKGAAIVTLALRDRYGDMGLVGAAVLLFEGAECRVDTFLMSCRALGRGAEDALFAACVHMAAGRCCTAMHGQYLPTAKNTQVKDFYPQRGFELVVANEDGSASYVLTRLEADPPAHFASLDMDVC
jgi:FkbH-like protein